MNEFQRFKYEVYVKFWMNSQDSVNIWMKIRVYDSENFRVNSYVPVKY